MWDYLKLIVLGMIAVLAAIAANYARDPAYLANAITIALAAVITFVVVLRRVGEPVRTDRTEYFDSVVRAGVIATAFWGVIGFLVGVVIALQLAFPWLNFELLQGIGNFGRLRPLHTSAVIFAFGGNALIATAFYVVQRTSAVRLWGGGLGWFVFWGYNLFIVLAASSYLLGGTQGKEYAEPVWYLDIWLTIVWVMFFLVYAGTVINRREPHIYVANWFYLAFILTIAMLHLVNNMAVPVSIFGSAAVQVTSGVQDAMIQWWYGHNAVGFFLTAGFLGMMYYFVPKQADRPVYSYKLSIIHFWALIFLYIWAGPHHLHYTALPEWAATLGMVFSIILWMPSWGGMINGLMTLSGAWDKLRTDPVLRMMVAAIAFYGMATFEGPMMSIKAVNSLSHYTDWTIGHVHSGALGWNGMITFGALYYLTPKLWNRDGLYSLSAVSWHFWLATIGIVLYASSMWVSGIMEGLMWREVDANGFLVNAFADTVAAKKPMNIVRALGGAMYLLGALIMCWNLWMTVRGQTARAPVNANNAIAAE
ncbi:cytochrome-c oxidase, cbb3-type subunit I [Pseudogemmobacter faecipullorum]|uniref:cytochrome-c oxidase n=1 Tax=Pseudogemmobacter faecipullorum TaxID=2755041 RepID=A0ABS8CJS0_9RHOB|nr:cytochrome-c oxidase, cbb3-type subunit I [Pseudogemmobacter faecipullorum]MCB5409619.1 cytochrome-c oxidase, cbb3-type subunit I [Pseudogemmobacter faecipullorum]